MFQQFSEGQTRCSRTACVQLPAWQIVWRNPKIHAPDREKVWLSCDEHKGFFEGYLGQRGFPVRAVAQSGDGA
jgi:hypothetical protein